MSTLRFEAPTLKEALEAARDKAGPRVKVTSATRVRRGGLGGFFAREFVEVHVEVPEAGSSVSRESREGPTAMASREPGQTGGTSQIGPRHARPPQPEIIPDEDPMAELIAEMAMRAPSSVLDLAELVNEEQSTLQLPARTAGRTGEAGRDRSPVGRTAAAAPGRPRSAVRPDPERPGPASDDVTAERTGTAAPPPGFTAVLERVAKQALLAGEAVEPAGTPAGGAAARRLPARQAGAERPERALPAKQAGVERPAPAEPTSTPGLAKRLCALGLPAYALPPSLASANLAQLEVELVETLARVLPAVPEMPVSPGTVVAVVGAREDVMVTAAVLAAGYGAPASEVALASRHDLPAHLRHDASSFIASAEEANERRRGWRWRERPAVVAVESDARPQGDPWAASVLRALEPTVCWGAVEASRKPEDVAAWSAALGRLDVLAVVDPEETTTPAAVLATRLPVGLLGGEPATPALWAKALCRRLVG